MKERWQRMLPCWEAWGTQKCHSCLFKVFCTSERKKYKISAIKLILNFPSEVDLMLSMNRRLVWLENILSPISCQTCWFLAVKRSAVQFLVFEHQSFTITKPLPLAVRPAQSQLADLSVFSRIRQKYVSFTWCSSPRLHQPWETWVH